MHGFEHTTGAACRTILFSTRHPCALLSACVVCVRPTNKMVCTIPPSPFLVPAACMPSYNPSPSSPLPRTVAGISPG